MAATVSQQTMDQVNAQIATATQQIAIHQQALAKAQQDKTDWENVKSQLTGSALLNVNISLL